MVDWRLQDPNAFDTVRVVVRKQRRGDVSTHSLIESTICRTTDMYILKCYSINLNTSFFLTSSSSNSVRETHVFVLVFSVFVVGKLGFLIFITI